MNYAKLWVQGITSKLAKLNISVWPCKTLNSHCCTLILSTFCWLIQDAVWSGGSGGPKERCIPAYPQEGAFFFGGGEWGNGRPIWHIRHVGLYGGVASAMQKPMNWYELPFGLSGPKKSYNRWACSLVPPEKYGWTIRPTCSIYEWVCHQGWRCSLFPNYSGDSYMISSVEVIWVPSGYCLWWVIPSVTCLHPTYGQLPGILWVGPVR